jgi:hypothetical protein
MTTRPSVHFQPQGGEKNQNKKRRWLEPSGQCWGRGQGAASPASGPSAAPGSRTHVPSGAWSHLLCLAPTLGRRSLRSTRAQWPGRGQRSSQGPPHPRPERPPFLVPPRSLTNALASATAIAPHTARTTRPNAWGAGPTATRDMGAGQRRKQERDVRPRTPWPPLPASNMAAGRGQRRDPPLRAADCDVSAQRAPSAGALGGESAVSGSAALFLFNEAAERVGGGGYVQSRAGCAGGWVALEGGKGG